MDGLCCCEYVDEEGERNHILACCCNCQNLDEGFEGLVSGRGVSPTNKAGFLRTMRDRARIPWLGGARQMKLDTVIAILTLPSLILLASVNFPCTILACVILLALLTVVFVYFTEQMPKFFLMFSLVSVITLFVLFQLIVIPFLMIYLEENIGASVAMFVSLFCVYMARTRVAQLREEVVAPEKQKYCLYCDVYVPEGTKHKFWIDACIITTNKRYYTVALISGLTSLIYSSNLTLTSVCHPYRFYFSIMLPDDCSDVYNIIDLSLSFVSALYSLLLCLFLLVELLCVLHDYWGRSRFTPKAMLGGLQRVVSGLGSRARSWE